LRVLLTGTEYSGGLAALRALRAAGHEPWAAVTSARAYGALSRAAAGTVEVPDAREDPAGFAAAVVDGAERTATRMVLPGTEGGLLALAAHRDRVPAEIEVGVCSPAVTAGVTDKVRPLADAAEAGISVLSARVLGANGHADTADVRYPVVVKPLRSELPVDGKLRRFESKRADDREQLTVALAGLPDGVGIVQAYAEGRLVTVNGVAWEGEVVAEVHAEAVRTWRGAVTYAQTIQPDGDLAERSRALMARLGWSGVFNLQFIEGEHGLFLIEVDPRLYTSLGLAVAAGVNLPAIWVDALLGRRPEQRPYAVGVHFRAEDDLRSLAHQFRTGDRRQALAGLLPQPNTAHGVVSLSDPRPGLSFLGRLPGRLRPGSGGVIARSLPG
jgi:predicted ATP-grasp superfamily ATP-dependent carboligase